MRAIDRIFGLASAGTTTRTELAAGTATFLTMAYIIFVQPAVLSGQMFGFETGLDFGAVLTATCLAAAFASILMGVLANYPIAQAPGMGENFFFALTVIPAAAAAGFTEPWRVALGVVFVAGVAFLIITVAGIQTSIIAATSRSMRSAVAVGIGLFIAFIGLQSAGIIVRDPGTGVALTASLRSPDLLVFAIGLLSTAALHSRGVRGALLIGMGFAFAAALVLRATLAVVPELEAFGDVAESALTSRFALSGEVVSAPPSIEPTLFRMDLAGALSISMLPFVVVFLFMDVFDTLGTLVGVGERIGVAGEDGIPRAKRALLSDAAGTIAGGCLGTSTVTSYIESVAGVQAGGRTGLTAVVCGLLFLAALFFRPLVEMIGSYPAITAPAMVFVGAMMMQSVRKIDWEDPTEAIPAFLTLIGIPLTYSIADGLAIGFLAYPIVKITAGRGREVGWVMRILALILIAYFVLLRNSV